MCFRCSDAYQPSRKLAGDVPKPACWALATRAVSRRSQLSTKLAESLNLLGNNGDWRSFASMPMQQGKSTHPIFPELAVFFSRSL